MDVLCADKTGTLTQDKIVLARHADVFGRPSDEVLDFAFLNSHCQTGLKNLLDHAVLEHVELKTELKLERDYRKIDETPFDFERRRMSVVVSRMVSGRDEHHELICKGALEELLTVCTRVRIDNGHGPQEMPFDAAVLARVQQTANSSTHWLNWRSPRPGRTWCWSADLARAKCTLARPWACRASPGTASGCGRHHPPPTPGR